MFLQSPGAGARWPAQAVHDTVAAIMRDAAYRRSLRESIFDRWLSWIAGIIRQFMSGVRESPSLRYTLLAAGALIVVTIAARIIVGRRTQSAAAARDIAARRVIRGDPLAEAERAAADGRYTDAAHALYQAVIDSLARGSRLRIHRSKTSGDYARELRGVGSPAYATFRSFGRLFDRIIFGRGACDEGGYRELLELARPLITVERAA
jgi:hypothetical protein